jgi:hypothetical protein
VALDEQILAPFGGRSSEDMADAATALLDLAENPTQAQAAVNISGT